MEVVFSEVELPLYRVLGSLASGRMPTTHDRTTRLLRSSSTIEPALESRSAVRPPTGGDHDQKARGELWQCAGLGGYGRGDRAGGADPLRGVQGGHSRAR